MQKFSLIVIVLLAMAAFASRDAMGADARAAEPTAAAQQEAEKLVKDIYKDEYAKKSPEDRKALGVKLLEQGRSSQKDPVSEYVLYREARDVASSAGDIETAMAAITEMGKNFNVDAVDMRLKLLTGMRSALKGPEATQQAADAAMTLVDEAMAAESFENATKAADLAASLATMAKNLPLAGRAQLRRGEIKANADASMEARLAAEQLKKNPKDAEAKFSVGLYQALYKNEWEKGLPYIAESSDSAWSTPAKADIASPVDVPEMVKVADAWFDLATTKPQYKSRIFVRADFWYTLALPSADGLIKAKIEKRLEQIALVKAPAVLGVSEATKKAMPTPVELAKLKELFTATKSNAARRGELVRMQTSLHNRLRDGLAAGTESDFFARCKADQQLRKLAQDNNDLMFGMQPLVNDFNQFGIAAKNKDEFMGRLLSLERFAAVEKTPDTNQLDGMVYSTLRTFVAMSPTLFPTPASKVQYCEILKEKGIKSVGVERFRTEAARFK